MANQYIERADLESHFGTANIRGWADPDSTDDEATIAANIQTAIAVAENYVDDRMRDGPYVVPIQSNGSSLAAFKYAVSQLAAWNLYAARGLADDGNAEAGKMTSHRERAEALISDYLSETLSLGAVKLRSTGTAPIVVTEQSLSRVRGYPNNRRTVHPY